MSIIEMYFSYLKLGRYAILRLLHSSIHRVVSSFRMSIENEPKYAIDAALNKTSPATVDISNVRSWNFELLTLNKLHLN